MCPNPYFNALEPLLRQLNIFPNVKKNTMYTLAAQLVLLLAPL
jgi:hypothetical protein